MLEMNEHNEAAVNQYNFKSICCEKIPELFLDKLLAKKHFGKFGKITRFILRPSRFSCTVEYDTEKEAERALTEGDTFNGYKFTIKYSERTEQHVQNTEEWVNPEVQSELDSMLPGVWRSGTSTQSTFGRFNAGHATAPSPAKIATTKIAAKPSPMDPRLTAANDNIRMELEAIMRRPACTTEEKYRVLDARDKLIRLTTVRQTNINKAVSMKGHCPDMCPEKERLLREYQRQVSIFEESDEYQENQRDLKISHRLAIKEYSRSSADQDTPLPHELRPTCALHLTMTYLMHNIMDLCDNPHTSLGDWFHFVWDRTRSIRKDITQQELCSPSAVQMVEQCARFHIHCAARLVAEEPMVFDKMINAENLTKCLQTLKYMYHDLRLKNIVCPCEAEFRSYVILLNLGDSNFLWELKQLPEYLQKSSEIKRAICFYKALQDNNYTRFFNLIREKETSYLSACILLGYFNRLRVRAMKVIIKSHNWRKNDVFLPLTYIVRMLGFEDENEAGTFLQYHGLQCSDDRVLLELMNIPDGEFKMERAKWLVESKRLVSVGECIYGETLPSANIFENHEPHNSFNANGLLKSDAWRAVDQLTKAAKQELFAGNPMNNEGNIMQRINDERTTAVAARTSSLPMTGYKIGTRATAATTDNNIFKVPQTTTTPISPKQQQSYQQQNLFKQPTQSQQQQQQHTFKFHVPTTTITAAVTPLKATNFEPNMEPKSSILQTRSDFHQFNAAQHSFSFVGNNEREKLEAEKRQAESVIAAKKAAALAAAAEAEAEQERILQQRRATLLIEARTQCSEILDEMLASQIPEIVDEVYTTLQYQQDASEALTHSFLMEQVQEQLLESVPLFIAEYYYEQNLLRTSFRNWLQFMRQQKRKRELIECTPIWVTTSTRQQQISDMTSNFMPQLQNLEMMRRYRQGEACNFSALLQQNLSNQTGDVNVTGVGGGGGGGGGNGEVVVCGGTAKLNLWKLIGNLLPSEHIGQRKYYKLLLTLPEETEELIGFQSQCEHCLNRYVFRRPPSRAATAVAAGNDDDDNENDDYDGDASYINDVANNLALCVRKISGGSDNRQQPLNEHGMPCTPNDLSCADGIVCFASGYNLGKTRARLAKIENSNRKAYVALIVFGCAHNEAHVAERLMLQKSTRYRIFGCQQTKSQFNFVALLNDAVTFLARKTAGRIADKKNTLEMSSVDAIVADQLGEQMWQRWQHTALSNPAFGKVCCSPQYVVELYNEAVKHLKNIVTADDFQQSNSFPAELYRHVTPIPNSSNQRLPLPYFPCDWRTAHYRVAFGQFMECIQLPAMPQIPLLADYESSPEQFEQTLHCWLLAYGSCCLPDSDELATKTTYRAIETLVEQMNRIDLNEFTMNERVERISYLNIVKCFAFERIERKLKTLSAPRSAQLQWIVYRRQNMENFHLQPWWLNFEPVVAVHVDYDSSEQAPLEQPQLSIKPTTSFKFDDAETASIIVHAQSVARRTDKQLAKMKAKALTVHNKNVDLKRVHEKIDHRFDESLKAMSSATNIAIDDNSCDVGDYSDENIAATNNISSISDSLPGGKRRKCFESTMQTAKNTSTISQIPNPDLSPTNSIDKVISRARDLIERIGRQQQ